MSESEFNALFAKNLNMYMELNHMNQQDLLSALRSKGIKVGSSSISNWCTGKKTPRMDKIDAICELFGIRRSDLIEDKHKNGYYTDDRTAKLAQEMFEDPDMRSLFDMKHNMDPDKFKLHVDYLRKMYKLEHPEDDDDGGC